jgi:hypothetical protein
MKRLFLALFFTIIIISGANAQSTLALQEKCAEGAKKLYKEISWGDLKIHSYECHYNKKLDRCFAKFFGNSIKKDETIYSISLVDVFEDKEIASYMCQYGKGGILKWRSCHLGDTQSFDMMNGFEFNKQTKKWDITSEAYLNSFKNPFTDPIREKFDNWVKPYMGE